MDNINYSNPDVEMKENGILIIITRTTKRNNPGNDGNIVAEVEKGEMKMQFIKPIKSGTGRMRPWDEMR